MEFFFCFFFFVVFLRFCGFAFLCLRGFVVGWFYGYENEGGVGGEETTPPAVVFIVRLQTLPELRCHLGHPFLHLAPRELMFDFTPGLTSVHTGAITWSGLFLAAGDGGWVPEASI